MSTTIPAESPTLSVELTAHPVDAAERARLLENPGFGALYGEHMVRIDYVAGEGWSRSRLQPYGTIELEAPGSHPDVRKLVKIERPNHFYLQLRWAVFGERDGSDPNDDPKAFVTAPIPDA